MKITVKNVGNLKFEIETDNETTVADLQKRIVDDAPEQFLKGGIIKKLILKGKKLKDSQKLCELGMGAGDEIVCLSKKIRAKKGKTPSPKKTETEQKENEDGLPTYQINPRDINKLMMMGFPQHQVIASLRASFGEPGLACKYLIAGGIPQEAAERLQKEEVAIKAKLVKEGRMKEGQSIYDEAPQQEGPVSGPNGLDAKFEALLTNKDALAEVMNNSKVQQQCMQMLAHEQPELFKKFMENPDKVGGSDEFAKAMFMIMQKSFAAKPDKPNVIKLTKEDRENLTKLQEECHVNRQQAAQVYIQNGKSFERSKAFLDDLMRQAMEQAPAGAAPGPKVASPRAAASANSPRLPKAFFKEDKNIRIVENDGDEKENDNEDTVLTIDPSMLFGDDEE